MCHHAIFSGYNDFRPIQSDQTLAGANFTSLTTLDADTMNRHLAAETSRSERDGGVVRLSRELRDNGGGAYGYALSRVGVRQQDDVYFHLTMPQW